MSTSWRITRGEQQFAAKDVAELKLMAVGGKIYPGDLVQPPGRTDWLYAMEVTELDGLLKAQPGLDDLVLQKEVKGARALRPLLLLTAFLLVIGGFGGLAYMWKNPPDIKETALVGDHSGALRPLEALVTQHATLLSEAGSAGKPTGDVKKDAVVELIQKQGDFYEVKTDGGTTGWVGTTQVIPAYMFDSDVRAKYAPRFNPDSYLKLINYSWTPSGDPKEPETRTNMMFHLINPTEYGMAGVVLEIKFFDGQDRLIETRNFEVPRLVAPADTMGSPGEVHLDGIDIDIDWDSDTRAEVKIWGAKALMPADYSRLKAEEDQRLAEEAAAETK